MEGKPNRSSGVVKLALSGDSRKTGATKMYRRCLESGESRNVVMSSYDIGLSTVDDVKKQKDQSQSL